MQIRAYRAEDSAQVVLMVKESILQVAIKAYTLQQVKVWAENITLPKWDAVVVGTTALVACEKGIIVGFGNMQSNGYLNMLFVHKDFQHQGVASALVSELEQETQCLGYTVYASILAKPLFEKLGYKVWQENTAQIEEQKFLNYFMQKS